MARCAKALLLVESLPYFIACLGSAGCSSPSALHLREYKEGRKQEEVDPSEFACPKGERMAGCVVVSRQCQRSLTCISLCIGTGLFPGEEGVVHGVDTIL